MLLRCGHRGCSTAIVAAIAFAAMHMACAAGSMTPPADYHVQEGIWIRENRAPANAWATPSSLQERLLLSSCLSKLDIAYVVRAADPRKSVNATFILFRNSDTHQRFDANGTLYDRPLVTGCRPGAGETEGVVPFWNETLSRDYAEYDQGYYYYLFLMTFDPRRYSGCYELRVNLTGIGGGSSWLSPSGNPRVPWIFFEVPSQAVPAIEPYRMGEILRASTRVSITCGNLPAGRSPPKEDYELFIDCASFANGSYYGSGFFRNGSQLPRGLEPGWHTLTVVGGEVVASLVFETHQWDVSVEVSPSVTIPDGVPVNITGRGFPVNESYTVFLVSPNGSRSQILGGAVSKFGNFSTSYKFPKETALGSHEIQAVATKLSGPPIATTHVTIDPWSVNLTVSPVTLYQGNWIDINGSLYPSNSRIEIYFDGEIVRSCTADENGTFFHRMYTLTNQFRPGMHVVSANATDYGGPPSGRVEIRVLAYNASIELTPPETNPGRAFTINGSGFPPDEVVRIEMGTLLLAEIVTGKLGSFEAECVAPCDYPLGNHTLRAFAPRHGGPPTGTGMIHILQWPVDIRMEAQGPHPGGWINIGGSGLPPGAPFQCRVGEVIVLQGISSASGSFEATPSLPANLSTGVHVLSLLIPGYSGPPSAALLLNITDWAPLLGITPTSPRPGEALLLRGSGLPRGVEYNITLDGIQRGTGNVGQDGSVSAYLFLNRNLPLGWHELCMSIDYPGMPAIVTDISTVAWAVGLNLSSLSGTAGSTTQIRAFGLPPGSGLRILWDEKALCSGHADLAGNYVGSITLPADGGNSYHTVKVECDGNYTGPPSAHAFFWLGISPPQLALVPCELDGSPRSTFFPDEAIAVRGSGFPGSTQISVSVVNISNGAVVLTRTALTDHKGDLNHTLLVGSHFRGGFSLLVDSNSNGISDGNDFVPDATFLIRPRPAVSIDGLTVDNAQVKEGEEIGIHVHLRNQCDSQDTVVAHIAHGDVEIGSLQLSLSPLETMVLHFEWDTSGARPGRRPMRVVVDPLPGETEAIDNCMEGDQVLVEPAPDIAVRSFVPSERAVRVGTVISVVYTVENCVSVQQAFVLELLWGEVIVASESLNIAGLVTRAGTLRWDTSGLGPGQEMIRLRTGRIPHEIVTSNNDLAAGSVTVLPPNLGPEAVPGGPYLGLARLPVTMDGSLSADPDGEISSYTWTLGNSTLGNGPRLSHAFDSVGIYDVHLTVIDDEGLSATNITRVRIVGRQDFSLWATDSAGEPRTEFACGEAVFATVSGPTDYGALVYVVYEGAFGQGSKLFDVSHGPTRFELASDQTLAVWSQPTPGLFGLILDLNSNGIYEPDIDRSCQTFLVVSEGATILAMLLVAASARLIGRSKAFK